jgi:antitoxin (DNA-binding transcriptional repressor) of toxin-antitoxin stability system
MRTAQQLTDSEAKERFNEVLSLVESGNTVEITRHGVVIARISRVDQPVSADVPDMDNSDLWQLSHLEGTKTLTEQLREIARY